MCDAKTPHQINKIVILQFENHSYFYTLSVSLSSCAVEFPAVLLNTSTGEVESEFHAYVQPQEHPILSEFCTELTGITQVPVHVTNICFVMLVYC